MDIRDPEYRGMAKLALDRKDEILALRATNKRLKEVIEEAGSDFYYIHHHSEDAHNDSYEFANKIEQVLKEMEKL